MNSIEVSIRKGIKQDLPAVMQLIRELAEFEKAPDAVTNTVAQMEIDGFGVNPAFEFLVADTGNEIIGMSLYFIRYSTWKGTGLYLDDLVITEQFRGQGIGKKLFDATIAEAKKKRVKFMHWQVLDWNQPAIDFYKKYNASIDAEWLDCKLYEKQLLDWTVRNPQP